MNWIILKQLILDNDKENFAAIVQQNAGILEERSSESLDTVLHLATQYGRIELVAEILRLCPFMVGAENKKGETPLHEACRLGHDKILMMLLETDPWVASKLNCEDQSALYLACCYGHLKAACIFLNQPWLQELDDGENATFLHVAASEGHIEWIFSITPCLQQRALRDNSHALLRLNPEQAFQFNRNGYAPVHLAAINGSSKVLKELLSAAPTSFELLSRKGETVFHLTVKFGRFDAFRYLAQAFENRSLFYQPDKNGDTCLHLAITGGHHKIAEYIIKEGGEQINYRNLRGDTAMDLLEQAENTSSRQNLRDLLEAAGAKTNSELSGSTENINIPTTELLILEELLDENTDTNFNLRTQSENRTQTRSNSSSNNELKIQSPKNIPVEVAERIPRFGEPSDRETSSRRKKISRRQMRQYKHQSEKSRKNLIRLYHKQHKRHEIYREALHNARETITLVAILIATITYTGGINPPGGVYQDGPLRGTALAARRTAFKVFSICNNVALFASLCIVIVFVSIIPFRRKPLMLMLMVAHKAMWVAVGFMAAAYFASSLVLMPPPHGQRMDWTVVSLLSISAATLGSVFVGLGFMLMRHHLKKSRYRNKVTDSKEHGETAKDTDTDADKNSVEFGDSINSDMDISIVMGYHAY
ncbi:hypothetical protein DH2020_041291 [Rehmannia glutinosa]|uniref:PGG domain-containing protein n=1 Tax=Rehmannia glutinosa TaxID=99300 RepID=A0ABR0URV2_REHGL